MAVGVPARTPVRRLSAVRTESHPSSFAARATSLTSTPRGDGRGACDHHVELVGTQRGGSRRIAKGCDDEDPPTVGLEIVEEHLGAVFGPSGLWVRRR